MLNKRNIVMLSLFCLMLMIIIPFTVAESVDDNQTLTVDNQDEDVLKDTADYYFNASAEDDSGDGSFEKPYKYLKKNRIKDNSTIHLASGEYELNSQCNITQVNIVGEDALNTVLKYDFTAFIVNDYLSLTNVTLNNATILNYGTVDANNAIFCNGEGVKFKSGDSKGGAIYTLNNPNSKVTLTNCTFKDNFATYGGAICMETGVLEVYNSNFINNYAYAYGGAISCDYCENITIYNSKFKDNYALYGGAVWIREGDLAFSDSEFINNSAYNFGGAISAQDCGDVEFYNLAFVDNNAIEDAGGAVYIISSKGLTADNINISDSSAYYGAAITTLNTTASINHLNAFNNVAKYFGGAIYQMYCRLTLTNSNFFNNSALNGGALFIDNSTLDLTQNSFVNNTAEVYGGAIYSLFNNLISGYSANTFDGNHARYNDTVHETNEVSINRTGKDYLIFKLNEIPIDELPASYSMLDKGYLTPVKDQGDGGNCWAFTAMAVLESCIKMINGQDYDFSEENVKNLMAYFSDIGWNSKTNDGGTNAMAQGYFTSWLGPVNNSNDVYSEYSVLSPILNSLLHIQNILFLGRESFTDNDAIKMAIMKYGAVGSSLFYDDYFFNGHSYYVNDNRYKSNHAVTVVGWDDNYSKHNFKLSPPGDGAWLVKNSWGTDWGNNGYFYVSYYDRTLFELGKNNEGYTFILNDTIRFAKNYQYDRGCTNYPGFSIPNILYKNIFTATDNEILAAVSTSFLVDTHWTVSINVNNVLKTTKSGFSNSGYWTIILDDIVHLNKGDVFEIVFNITCDGGKVHVPISDYESLNKPIPFENVSYVSANGYSWSDIKDVVSDMENGVICVKAFTIVDDIKTNMSLDVIYDGYNPVNITVRVVDEYGNLLKGDVTFNINGKEIVLKLVNGEASFVDNFEIGLNNVSCIYNKTDYVVAFNQTSFEVSRRNTELTLDITRKVNNLFINITSKDNINDTFVLQVNNDNYTLNLVNGFASYDLTDLENGVYSITAVLESLVWQASDTKTVEVNIKNTHIVAEDLIINDEDLGNLTFALTDEDNNPLPYKIILIGTLSVKTDANGVVSIPVNLSRGKYSITLVFEGDDDYFASNASVNIIVKTNIDAVISVNTYLDTADIRIEFTKDLDEMIRLTVNGNSTDYHISNATFNIPLNNLSNGNYDVLLDLLNDDYNFTQKKSNFTINAIRTQIIASDLIVNDEELGNFTVTLVDENGNPLSNKTVLIGIESVTTDGKGVASIPINYPRGKYPIDIIYDGDETYFKSSASCTIHVKTNIESEVSFNTTLRDADISITFSRNINDRIAFTINDNTTNYTLVDGKFNISLKGLSNGIYHVLIDLLNDDYNFTQGSADFIINVIKTQILAEDFITTDFSGDEYSIILLDENNYRLPDMQIRFNVNGMVSYVKTDTMGIASIPISLDANKYSVTVSYSNSSDYYDASEVTRLITVKTSISTEISHQMNKNNAIVTIAFSKAINGTAEVKINNIQKNFTVKNGKLLFSLSNLSNGRYSINVMLSDDYVLSNNSYEFTVNMKQTHIIADSQSVYYHSGGIFKISMNDENSKPLANKDLIVVLNGKTSTLRTDNYGVGSLVTDDLAIGKYSISIKFEGDEDYFASSALADLTVISSISLPQSKYTLNSEYVVTFYDRDGPMVERQVNVTFNNAVKMLTTDGSGQVRIVVNLGVGSYNVNVANPETGEVKSQTIQVVSRLSGNANVVMYYGAGKTYTVRVFNDYGQAAKAGEEVIFKIAGNSYKVKTDKNGYASYKITSKAGNYKITASYKGFTVSNKVTVKPTLITKDKKAKKGKKIKYQAKLLNNKGKALKGKKITFKIKGKTYKAKTNKKGIAKITIKKGLKVGKYTITVKYGKLKSTSKITVKK